MVLERRVVKCNQKCEAHKKFSLTIAQCGLYARCLRGARRLVGVRRKHSSTVLRPVAWLVGGCALCDGSGSTDVGRLAQQANRTCCHDRWQQLDLLAAIANFVGATEHSHNPTQPEESTHHYMTCCYHLALRSLRSVGGTFACTERHPIVCGLDPT